jgi:hypothetical protein
VTIFFIPKCPGPHVEYVARGWKGTKLRHQMDPDIFPRKYSGRHVENVSEVGTTHRYIYTCDGIFLWWKLLYLSNRSIHSIGLRPPPMHVEIFLYILVFLIIF